MSLHAPHAVVFDLDGTLVDSRAEISATLQEAVRACGLPAIPPLGAEHIGPPLDVLLPRLLPGLDAATVARVRAAFTARYDASDYALTRPYAGAHDLLALLAAQGVALFVATAKRAVPTLRLLAARGLGPFADVACVDSVPGTSRTKSAMVGELVAAHGLDAARTWMVGDTASDLRAAKDHGLVAVAAAYGYGSPAELAAEAPDATVRSVPELAALVRAAAAEVA